MEILLALIAALLPAILLWLYIWKKDAKPEPASQLIKAVLWGVGICIPVAIVEMIIGASLFGITGVSPNLVDTTVNAFVMAALPEESFKLLALWIVLKKNPYFDEHYDGIVYAVCVGLGFAAIENIIYVFSSEAWLSVAITRALLAVPGHYAFAILMGYYYSVYHFVDHSKKNAAFILLVPILAHGIYDALVFGSELNPVISVIATIILICFCIKLQKIAKRKVLALVDKDKNEIIQEQV